MAMIKNVGVDRLGPKWAKLASRMLRRAGFDVVLNDVSVRPVEIGHGPPSTEQFVSQCQKIIADAERTGAEADHAHGHL